VVFLKKLLIFLLLVCTVISAVACQDPVSKYTSKGTHYFDAEKWNEAIAEYTKALGVDPAHVEALTNRGSAYTHIGKYSEALVDLDRAVELDPQNIIPYYNRCILFLYMGRYDDCIADCNTIITDLGIEYHWVYYHRGQAYKEKGDYNQALADFMKARGLTDNLEFRGLIDKEIEKLNNP
jgi:tetratricopeptide (TPR) repeat protein